MDLGIKGPISIQQPVDLTVLGKSEKQQLASDISTSTGKPIDEVMTMLDYLESTGTNLEQKHLNRLKADDPLLPDPPTLGANIVTELVSARDGNPWFSPNPFATFFNIFLELQADLSKIKLTEGMTQALMINLTMDMAMDLAEIIKDIYEVEAVMHIAAAVSAAVGGVANIVGGAGTIGTGNMGYQAFGQGIGQVATMGEKIVAAIMTFQRAELEFTKTVIENGMKILQDRGMASASEAQRTADEMISQILQKLDKIIDEAMRAHGFQVH